MQLCNARKLHFFVVDVVACWIDRDREIDMCWKCKARRHMTGIVCDIAVKMRQCSKKTLKDGFGASIDAVNAYK